MTRQELFEAMLNRTVVTIKGIKGMINAIAMEDGSGFSFNITMESVATKTKGNVLYVRCRKPPTAIS